MNSSSSHEQSDINQAWEAMQLPKIDTASKDTGMVQLAAVLISWYTSKDEPLEE